MLPALGPRGQHALGALCDRWSSFDGKLRARIHEILGETDAGMRQIIGMDPTNPGSVSAAISAVGGRLQALGAKVQEAESKISAEWDQARDDADLESSEAEAARATWSALVGGSRELQRALERTRELFEISAGASWARALHPLAQAEVARPRQCAHCGGPLQPTIAYAACNVTCSHCGAVSTLEVGLATGLYYGAVHDLAREQARDAWVAQFEAETWLRDIREPSTSERNRYLTAVRAYWTAYFDAFAHLHPGMNRTIEQSVADKMTHYESRR